MANPSGKELAREAGRMQTGKFAEQTELSFANDVDWIRDREVVSEVFIPYSVFFDMMHIDSK